MEMCNGPPPPALHTYAGDGEGDWYPPVQAACTRLHPHTLSLFLMYVADGTSIPGSKTEGEILGGRLEADMTVGWTVMELLGGLTEREMPGGRMR
jgi:hypothetical protein